MRSPTGAEPQSAVVVAVIVAVAVLLGKGEAARGAEAAAEGLARVLSAPDARLPWREPPELPPDLHGTECEKALTSMRDNVFKAPWAFKMFDASTKVPEGIMFGHLIHLGNFDECLSVRRGKGGKLPAFDGQHCLVRLSARVRLGKGFANASQVDEQWQALTLAEDSAALFLGGTAPHLQEREALASLGSVTAILAWCAPSSCSPAELTSIANYALESAGASLLITASVTERACHTHVREALRGVDIFAICLLALFVGFALCSTAYDVLTKEQEGRSPLLLAFSVYTNIPKLFAITHGRDQLTCLNGIRVISIGWVVLGHVYMINATSPAINTFDYLPDFIKSFARLTIMNATVSVDTFFLLSGILLSFLFLKEVEKTNRFDVVKFYVHRYFRLTPAVAILILLTATLFKYSGTGPYWDLRNYSSWTNCEDNWWTNLLYVNNYVYPDYMCNGHTWYLAVDMQLYWLSPLVLVPLWKMRRKGLMWLCFLLLVGWVVPFTIVYVLELYPGTYVGPVDKRNETMNKYYRATHTRFVPWLLGVLLGYILHESRKRKLVLPSWLIACGWVMSTLLMLVALNAAYPFQQPGYKYSRVEAAFWLSLFRPMWALGVAWIIFACDQGYGGIVNIILSWNFFQPLARLSYGVYLMHIPILTMLGGSVQTPAYLADVFAIPQFLGVLIMSVAWAIPTALLFESPIITIEKFILGGVRKPRVDAQKNLKSTTLQGIYNEGLQT